MIAKFRNYPTSELPYALRLGVGAEENKADNRHRTKTATS